MLLKTKSLLIIHITKLTCFCNFSFYVNFDRSQGVELELYCISKYFKVILLKTKLAKASFHENQGSHRKTYLNKVF